VRTDLGLRTGDRCGVKMIRLLRMKNRLATVSINPQFEAHLQVKQNPLEIQPEKTPGKNTWGPLGGPPHRSTHLEGFC
jgi:hypothetical protein